MDGPVAVLHRLVNGKHHLVSDRQYRRERTESMEEAVVRERVRRGKGPMWKREKKNRKSAAGRSRWF